MDIRRLSQHLLISDLDPFLTELLRQIPESTRPDGVAAAEQRIYSKPANATEQEACAEWTAYVEPELRRLFQGSTEVVAEDLKQLESGAKPFANSTLRIPVAHADEWLNALNQARLVIAAKFNFSDAELCDHYRSPIGSRRDLSLFQVNFYGFLQEFILRELHGHGDAAE